MVHNPPGTRLGQSESRNLALVYSNFRSFFPINHLDRTSNGEAASSIISFRELSPNRHLSLFFESGVPDDGEKCHRRAVSNVRRGCRAWGVGVYFHP